MTLASIFNTAASGLRTAQTGLRVVSDNVANINTPGYVRKVVDQASIRTAGGVGDGVEVARIRLAADRFLQTASLNAGSTAAEAGVLAELLDGAQALFGDPTGKTSFFDRVDNLFTRIEAAANDPTSPVGRSDLLHALDSFLDDAARIGAGLQSLRTDADARVSSGVERVNQLLKDIEALNVEISRSTVAGRSASDAENAQATLIDELSKLVDVRVAPRSHGGVTIRTGGDGTLLAGDGAATLAYLRTGSLSLETSYGQVTITPPGGQPTPLLNHIAGGELKGLVAARDRELPALAEQLAEFVSRTADELNRAHNASSAVPAPPALSGRNTGLDEASAVGGFTGRAVVAVTDAAGRVTRRVDVDFTAGSMSVNGGGAVGFAPGGFAAALDAALDPAGDASFSNGVLTVSARGGAGVAVSDDPAQPALKTGRGFAHFFGLNDLVRSDQPHIYETGLRASDPHGFSGPVTLRLSNEAGARLRDVTVTAPPGGTMTNLLDALNAAAGGVGLYGRFNLDSQGRVAFTATTAPPAQLSVLSDETSRGPGGPSFTALFGIGSGQRASRADGFSIRQDVAADPRRLALAQFETGAAVGGIALSSGDRRGGALLAAASERTTEFSGGRDFSAASMSLERYGAAFSGTVGARAAAAEERRTGAEAVAAEAQGRRIAQEGVNLDEELVLLTTYQQAYNASARLIQAAKDMYDVLLQMS